MKSMNTMMFISNATEELVNHLNAIKTAETFEIARQRAARMIGYIECMHTVTNTMTCMENNDFTAEISDVLANWEARVYSAMGAKAVETKQEAELICKYFKTRDEILAGI